MHEHGLESAEYFRAITLRLFSSLELEVALHRCLSALREKIPAEEIWASVIDFSTWTLRPMAMADQSGGKAFGEDGPRIPMPEESRVELRQAPKLAVRRVDTPADDSLAKKVAERYGTPGGSLLTLRLSLEGERLGAITLRHPLPASFTLEHERLLGNLREPFAIALSNYSRHREVLRLQELLAEDNRFLQRELVRISGEEIVGGNLGMRSVLDQVARVAAAPSPVLLLGETGVGKEVIANAIHRSSPRAEGPLIKVNCGSIPESLMDSELFGHERGAFTGALEKKRGLFERAHGGTLFLDEVGELPATAQVRLLRALQEKEIQRVGGGEPIRIDLRIVAATHRDLPSMVRQGAFREDLWFRISVFPIHIPPLRDRRGDIPALVDHAIRRKAKELGLASLPRLTQADLDLLRAYAWPGNVRELHNVIERALILSDGRGLTFDGLLAPPPGSAPARATPAIDLPESEGSHLPSLEEVESAHLRRVLAAVEGRIEGAGGAAAILGLNPSTLRHRLRKLGIPFGRATSE